TDDPGDLASLIDNDQTAHAPLLHQTCSLRQGSVPAHSHGRGGHDLGRHHAPSLVQLPPVLSRVQQAMLVSQLLPPLLEQKVGFGDDADRRALRVHDRDRADPVVFDETDQNLELRRRGRHMNAARHHIGDGPVPRNGDHAVMRSAMMIGRSVVRSSSCETEPKKTLPRSPILLEPLTTKSASQPSAISATDLATGPACATMPWDSTPASSSSWMAFPIVSWISS